MSSFQASSIKALVFDVFGTVVDWRGSIVREGEALAAKGLQVDWPAFADAWRAGYRPAMQRVRDSAGGWANIDTVRSSTACCRASGSTC
jgi:2-haloacid dehalogenase